MRVLSFLANSVNFRKNEENAWAPEGLFERSPTSDFPLETEARKKRVRKRVSALRFWELAKKSIRNWLKKLAKKIG